MPYKESFPRQDKTYGSVSSEQYHIFMLHMQTAGDIKGTPGDSLVLWGDFANVVCISFIL